MKWDFMKKLAIKLEQKNDAVFSYPIEKQKSYINSLKKPENSIERSYNQYCCQMQFNGRIITVLLDIVSLPLLVYLYMKGNCIKEKEEHYDAVFFSEGIPEHVIPESLKMEFNNWFMVKSHGEHFSKDDRKYFKSLIKKYPFSWHFLLKCLIKLRFYSYELKVHTPSAIIVCGEYSFTSSVLTDYCGKNGILHINVMHGEKLFFMRDSFFRFDRCYVWDEYYAKLFKQLKAYSKQFIIEIPPSLKFGANNRRNYRYDYTYYLAAESENALKIIANILCKLKKRGFSIVIRPHPRYSKIEQITVLFDFAVIEDPNKITIEDSLMQTGYAISVYSTVLNQALRNSVPIIIDNISNPENFKKLKQLGYICMEKEHQLLSDII